MSDQDTKLVQSKDPCNNIIILTWLPLLASALLFLYGSKKKKKKKKKT